MCNRVRADFEFREIKLRWDLVNDLPQVKPIYNASPGRRHPNDPKNRCGQRRPPDVLATDSIVRKKHEASLQHDEREGRTAESKSGVQTTFNDDVLPFHISEVTEPLPERIPAH